jgi:hypothetical protein
MPTGQSVPCARLFVKMMLARPARKMPALHAKLKLQARVDQQTVAER